MIFNVVLHFIVETTWKCKKLSQILDQSKKHSGDKRLPKSNLISNKILVTKSMKA
jgi:hypothetical protein